MPCQCCGKEVVVKVNERGTLSYCCQWCDDSPYQKPGTLAFAAWKAKMTPVHGDALDGDVLAVHAEIPAQEIQQQKPAPAKTAGLLL